MSPKSLAERLAAVVAEVLEVTPDVAITASRGRHAVWDSLNHYRIIVAAEEEFALDLTTGQALGIGSYSDLLGLITSEVAKRAP